MGSSGGILLMARPAWLKLLRQKKKILRSCLAGWLEIVLNYYYSFATGAYYYYY